MTRGFVISVLMHAALLAWCIVSVQRTPLLPPDETPSIDVAIITPSELLRLKQGDSQAKELEAQAKEEKPPESQKEAEKVKPIAAPAPAAAPPPEEPKPAEPAKAEPAKADPIAEKVAAAPPEEAPGPTAEEIAKQEAEKKAEEARQAEEDRKAREKKKADDKKKADEKRLKLAEAKKAADAKKKADEAKKKSEEKFSDKISALLDKTPDKRGAPKTALPPTKPTTYKGPTAGTREGRDSVLSAREIDILSSKILSQIRPCWKLPGGGGGIDTVTVTLRWRMNPDGSLDGEPIVDRPQSGEVFQIAAEAAVRAVKLCQPLDLPPDQYNFWKSITMNFDPSEMLR